MSGLAKTSAEMKSTTTKKLDYDTVVRFIPTEADKSRLKHSRNIAEHLKFLFENHYCRGLRPEIISVHGNQHAARVTAYIPILHHLWQSLDPTLTDLTTDDLFFTQLAAAFHDIARKNDGVDLWDDESAISFFHYLVDLLELDPKTACKYAEICANKDTHADGYHKIIVPADYKHGDRVSVETIPFSEEHKRTHPHKLLHDADCWDIMRCEPSFDLTYLEFIQEFKQKLSPDIMSSLRQAFEQVIKLSGDMSYDMIDKKAAKKRFKQNLKDPRFYEEFVGTYIPSVPLLYDLMKGPLAKEALSDFDELDPLMSGFKTGKYLIRAFADASSIPGKNRESEELSYIQDGKINRMRNASTLFPGSAALYPIFFILEETSVTKAYHQDHGSDMGDRGQYIAENVSNSGKLQHDHLEAKGLFSEQKIDTLRKKTAETIGAHYIFQGSVCIKNSELTIDYSAENIKAIGYRAMNSSALATSSKSEQQLILLAKLHAIHTKHLFERQHPELPKLEIYEVDQLAYRSKKAVEELSTDQLKADLMSAALHLYHNDKKAYHDINNLKKALGLEHPWSEFFKDGLISDLTSYFNTEVEPFISFDITRKFEEERDKRIKILTERNYDYGINYMNIALLSMAEVSKLKTEEKRKIEKILVVYFENEATFDLPEILKAHPITSAQFLKDVSYKALHGGLILPSTRLHALWKLAQKLSITEKIKEAVREKINGGIDKIRYEDEKEAYTALNHLLGAARLCQLTRQETPKHILTQLHSVMTDWVVSIFTSTFSELKSLTKSILLLTKEHPEFTDLVSALIKDLLSTESDKVGRTQKAYFLKVAAELAIDVSDITLGNLQSDCLFDDKKHYVSNICQYTDKITTPYRPLALSIIESAITDELTLKKNHIHHQLITLKIITSSLSSDERKSCFQKPSVRATFKRVLSAAFREFIDNTNNYSFKYLYQFLVVNMPDFDLEMASYVAKNLESIRRKYISHSHFEKHQPDLAFTARLDGMIHNLIQSNEIYYRDQYELDMTPALPKGESHDRLLELFEVKHGESTGTDDEMATLAEIVIKLSKSEQSSVDNDTAREMLRDMVCEYFDEVQSDPVKSEAFLSSFSIENMLTPELKTTQPKITLDLIIEKARHKVADPAGNELAKGIVMFYLAVQLFTPTEIIDNEFFANIGDTFKIQFNQIFKIKDHDEKLKKSHRLLFSGIILTEAMTNQRLTACALNMGNISGSLSFCDGMVETAHICDTQFEIEQPVHKIFLDLFAGTHLSYSWEYYMAIHAVKAKQPFKQFEERLWRFLESTSPDKKAFVTDAKHPDMTCIFKMISTLRNTEYATLLPRWYRMGLSQVFKLKKKHTQSSIKTIEMVLDSLSESNNIKAFVTGKTEQIDWDNIKEKHPKTIAIIEHEQSEQHIIQIAQIIKLLAEHIHSGNSKDLTARIIKICQRLLPHMESKTAKSLLITALKTIAIRTPSFARAANAVLATYSVAKTEHDPLTAFYRGLFSEIHYQPTDPISVNELPISESEIAAKTALAFKDGHISLCRFDKLKKHAKRIGEVELFEQLTHQQCLLAR